MLAQPRQLACAARPRAAPPAPRAARAPVRARAAPSAPPASAAASASPSGRSTMTPPYVVLVTGSSKGVGRALAEEFLRAGDSVVLCARNADAVAAAVEQLGSAYGADRVAGRACNVARAGEVRELAAFAQERFGRIDMWINNAGTNAYKYGPLTESDEDDLSAIVETNVLGVMLCCKEAINVMRAQPRGGHVLNMDGAGADGGATPRFAAYGATKRGLQQLSKSLEAELKLLDIKNVGVHNLSPGMVTTELLMSGADNKASKFFINCLAEEPEEVARFLVPRVRRIPQDSATLTGGVGSAYIRFLTKPKAYGQILRRLLLGERKDRFVQEE
ncbi:chlorophyll(ide) b reductase chloroplastic [Raphidocelis subcapitata]|uniref:Chlorophyll(Ide) b reductase chloroplastic n=1 Tax=Raphidocelis subcapitata TaxID=307507 RepID=A0A2V0PDK1_9CHLO|nr:chlorophyll(ide) b reductase chloroplastic [Raphidocelis subcapitata]|eukprot:GBF95247.1 chlorophyll(ide) b reductase chloroplastic [Raphidocelis subcapitata]